MLPAVARFEFFRRGDRPAGVWLVRQGPLAFALPITSGTRPGVADYLPSPHGLPGFTAPVEQTVPAGASYFELPDGRVLAATDGADDITPGADGRSLEATWRRFALVGGKTGNLIEPGFTVSITWRIDGATLTRTETLTAAHDVSIRRVSFLLSSTATSSYECTRPAFACPDRTVCSRRRRAEPCRCDRRFARLVTSRLAAAPACPFRRTSPTRPTRFNCAPANHKTGC